MYFNEFRIISDFNFKLSTLNFLFNLNENLVSELKFIFLRLLKLLLKIKLRTSGFNLLLLFFISPFIIKFLSIFLTFIYFKKNSNPSKFKSRSFNE